MTRVSAPAIGLRVAHRADGSPYLHGIASEEFTVPAGARVQLRRLRPDDDPGDGPTHAIVFAPPDPRLSAAALAQACRDATWHRNDPRHDEPQAAIRRVSANASTEATQ